MATAHVRTDLVEIPEANSKLMVICMDHVTSMVVNIIDEEMGLSLARALLEAEWYIENKLINGLVLCSGKHRNFLAGADILFELKMMNKQRAFPLVYGLGSIICKLESLDVPTFAIVNGAALGGGLELMIGCDFRVADKKHCSQLGLPEVKLGVLPGVGGCMRLPRVIGLSSALEFLLTGKQVDANKALKYGLVDCLFSATQTVKPDDNTSGSYQYQWLPELTTCLKARMIGKRKFSLKQIRGDASLEMPDFSQITVESIEKYMDWTKSNAKYLKKFPTPLLRNSWLEQQIKYWFAQRSIFKQVGSRMPSPYKCLHTIMACLNAADCLEAVKINAHGFVELVVTAESKCLMGLFLESCHAKKSALSYGQSFSTLSKENTVIIVLFNPVCRSEVRQSACFAQCAIYSGFHVVFAYNQHNQPSTEEVSLIAGIIHDQFSYLVGKGRMSFKEVSDKLAQLLSFHPIEQIVADVEDFDYVFVMDLTQTSEFACDGAKQIKEETDCSDVGRTLQSNLTKSKVFCVASHGGLEGDNHDSSVVNINMFYPLDRLTTTLEVFPSNPRAAMDDMSAVAALINALGKMPINAGLEQRLSVMNYMLISFWSHVANFSCSDQNVKLDVCKIDKIIGFFPGPFQVMDQIGLPYVLGLAQQAQSTGYDCDHLLHLLQPLVTAGDLGKMSGKGFYVWIGDKPKTSSDPLNETERGLIGMKLSLLAAVETSKRAPNVNQSLLDLICVSGPMNFPPQEGGPFHYFYRNPKLFASGDNLVVVRNPDADYSSTMLVKEVEEMGPCYGMTPLPMMVPRYTPNITLTVILVIVVLALIFIFF